MNEQVNFRCKHCNCDATTMGNLKEHQKSLHEDIKIPCTYWTYQATTKGSFAKDHVGVIYPCKHCSYKVTQKGELKGHQKLIHEGVKYIFKHCSYEATIIRNKCMKESNFLVNIAHWSNRKWITCKTPEGSSWRCKKPLQTLQLNSNLKWKS